MFVFGRCFFLCSVGVFCICFMFLRRRECVFVGVQVVLVIDFCMCLVLESCLTHTPSTCHKCTALASSQDLTLTVMTNIHHVLHSPFVGVKNRVAHRTQSRDTAIMVAERC